MSERPISEEHEAILKTALNIEESEPLPDNVRELYWDVERTARRIGGRVDGALLVFIAVWSGRPTPGEPVSFLDVIKTKAIKVQGRVLARHRNEWHWGKYKGVKGKKIVVQLDDDTAEDREFHPTVVRLPTRDEVKTIGE
jgi:hypothetical protein